MSTAATEMKMPPAEATTEGQIPEGNQSMDSLQPFEFEGHDVRVVEIDGDAWFVATDVARILQYRSAPDMTRRLEEQDKGYAEVRTPGGIQNVTVINESGLYDAVFRSNSEGAKPFRRWVTTSVLPTIRKTGGYQSQPAEQLTREQQVAQALILSQEIIGELTADNAAKDKELSEARPKAQAWDDLVGSKGTWSFNEAAAALQEVGGIDIGRNRLFKRSGEWGYLYREGGIWLAKQRYRDKGLFEHKLRTSRDHDSGEIIARPPQVRITGKGLKEIRKRLLPSVASQPELEMAR